MEHPRSLEDELRRLNALYSPTETEVEEEGTEVRGSGSALTDSFRTESCGLLDSFLKVLEGWATGQEAADQDQGAEEQEQGSEEQQQGAERGESEMPQAETRYPSRQTQDSHYFTTRRTELKEAKRLFAYRLVESEAPSLVEELAHYSQDGDEKLMLEDIPLILRSFGCNPTEKEAAFITKRISEDYGENIGIDNFLPILVDQQEKTYTTKEILGVFAALDVGNKGRLKTNLLFKLLTTRGERLTLDEWKIFLKEGDPTGSGFINYPDMVRRMERNTFVAIPEKRRILIRLLRKADKRGGMRNSSFEVEECSLSQPPL